ncbi:MAG: DUF4836 family protein [Odoribacteraceae bacterium]|jgi:hypothetical protein|nr:DUF4836 family protein [Odoribacteraceae bacterium]
MKKMKSILLLIPALAGMLLGSCRDSANDRAHYQAVPAETSILVSVRVEALSQKSGVADKLKPMFEQQPDALAGTLLTILNDGKASGLRLDEEVLFFLGKDDRHTGITAMISDREKFTKHLDLLAEKHICSKVEKQGDVYIARGLQMAAMLVFNDRVLVGVANDGEQYARELLAQPVEKSILSDEHFLKTLPATDDVLVYANAGNLLSLFNVKEFMGPLGDVDYSKVFNTIGLNFLDGEARLTVTYYSSDVALAELQAQITRPITRAHLDCIPASPLLLMIANFKGEEYNKFLENNLRNIHEVLGTFGNDVQMQRVIALYQGLIEASSSIDGECTFSITPSPSGIPSLVLYADVKDDHLVRFLDTQLSDIPFITNEKVDETTYRVSTPLPMLNFYYGVKEGRFFFTNNEEIYKNAGKKVQDSYKDSRLARRIPANTFGYFFVDIQSVIDIVTKQFHLPMDNKELVARFRYLESFTEGPSKFVFILEETNKDQNILKSIVDAVAVSF